MSGNLEFRVNRSWYASIQANVSPYRLLAEILAFFDDHPNYSIISYGTGKVETGVITPTTWKAWAESDGSGVCPFGDNSWFVVEAQKASASLNGDGSRKWQAKFQCTTVTGFDDCNVADVEHGAGTEGNDWSLYVRFSPDGGWVGAGTLDFVAVTASDNMLVIDDYASGRHCDWAIHLIGDDDTVIWVANGVEPGQVIPNYNNQKFGYLGEVVRRNSGQTKPELAIVSYLHYYGSGWDLGKGYNEVATIIFNSQTYGGTTVPSFSLAADGSGVTRHNFWSDKDTGGANTDLLFNGASDPWTGEDEFMGIVAKQDETSHRSILGQLRLIEAAGNHIVEGQLFGDGTRLSVGKNTATQGGLAVPWPGSTTLPIF